MSVVTQGTQFYVLNAGVVSEVECITGFTLAVTLRIKSKIRVSANEIPALTKRVKDSGIGNRYAQC